MDTDYKGWGGADSRRAFETSKTFSIERLRFKATQKWRGGLFRRDADERSGAKTKARLDFGFGIELAPGGDPDADERGRTLDAFRAECRLKARVSPDDAAPRLTVFFCPKPRIALGATFPLEGPARALLSRCRNDEAAEETKTREDASLPEGSLPLSAGKEAKTLSDGGDSDERSAPRGGGDEQKPKKKKKKSDTSSPRGVCVRVEAAAPLSFFLSREGRFGRTHDGVSVTARLVRPEARGAFVSTSGLEFDFPEIPLGGFKQAARDGETSDAKTRQKSEKRLDVEPGDALALRVRGSVDFPRAGFGASADGLGRVDGEDAPVRVSIRKLGVKRVVRWWRRPTPARRGVDC